MASLENLKTALNELSEEELMAKIGQIREDRKIEKRPPKSERQQHRAEDKVREGIADMSAEDKAAMIAMLKKQL